MSLEASRSDLKIQTDFWKKKLQAEQVLEIQNLGTVLLKRGDPLQRKKSRSRTSGFLRIGRNQILRY
jgi:hypothetical protein